MHYDQYQQTFALSALANWVGDRRGSQPVLQADYQATLLQTLASADTQDRIGDWQLVWGPQVWQAADSSLSGNAMYVAHTDAMPGIGEAYVVALSATNPESLYDWFTEDFDVSSVVDFATYTPLLGTAPVAAKKPVKPGSAVISMGPPPVCGICSTWSAPPPHWRRTRRCWISCKRWMAARRR
ncbi:hypothetical protein [Xanthomonas arboricola]|uniref:hypothetical protein n=1 Tax=Xanthomonas arboricola TaxID=56448 RepID=UPI003EBC3CC4